MSYATIALPVPVRQTFTYRVPPELEREAVPGAPVLVPFRGRDTRGVLIERMPTTALESVRDLREVLGPPVLDRHLLELARWVSEYYLAPPGEVVSAMLPGGHRGFAGSRARREAIEDPTVGLAIPERVTLTAPQQAAVRAITDAVSRGGYQSFLLHGVTGSGKTEVYLHAIADALARDDNAQVLMLVPEINLTPQLEARIAARFPGVPMAALHSGLAEQPRALNWLAAHRGEARIVLGTRLAMLASLPNLALILVDEEHDTSYKQQEGLRYSARDLALWRAKQRNIPVVLGSATPSLETWWRAEQTPTTRLTLSRRAQAEAVDDPAGDRRAEAVDHEGQAVDQGERAARAAELALERGQKDAERFGDRAAGDADGEAQRHQQPGQDAIHRGHPWPRSTERASRLAGRQACTPRMWAAVSA